MKKYIIFALILLLGATAKSADFSHLRLNEISGVDAVLFVEIFNSGTEEINLEGVRLQRNEGPTHNTSLTTGTEWVGQAGDVIPAGAYRIILFRNGRGDGNNSGPDAPSRLQSNPAWPGMNWTVTGGLSNQQILKIALVAPNGNPIDVFIRGDVPLPGWGTAGASRPGNMNSGTYGNIRPSYSRMADGSWAWAIVTPGTTNGPSVQSITNPGYLTAMPQGPGGDEILAGIRDNLAGKLLILQAYGSSSDANGTTHSFVELYNNSNEWIDLNGISLFFANGIRGLAARAAGVDAQWQRIPLNGTIPPRTSFLILGYRQNLNAPDSVGSGNNPRFAIRENSADLFAPNFSLSNRAFKVALIRSEGRLTVQNPFTMDGTIGEIADGYIDMLGSANDINHATNPDNIFGFETAPARNSGSQSARRINLNDTDNNSADFTTVDFRRSGTTDEELDIFRPKNRGFGPWNPFTGEQYAPSGDPNITTTITRFRFSYQDIGWGETGYWEGVIDQNARTITFTTQRWIENIHQLPAVFELAAAGVASVGERPQWSGITANDFRRNVIYTVGENHYTVRFVSPQATGLPVININTYGSEIHHSSTGIWTTMTFSLSDPNNPENDISTMTNQQIRGRGNTTWFAPKRPYRIRFRDDISVFGLAAHRNWILLANWFDPTLMKNTLAFELGRRLDVPFTNTIHHVELFLNGQFEGSYAFTEHRQADPNQEGAPGRVLIDPEVGWFVELDLRFDTSPIGGDPGFRTENYDLPVLIRAPDFPVGVIPGNVDNFVRNDWENLTRLMASESFPENEYRDLIDMESIINYFLVKMIMQNTDFDVPLSTFFHKGINRKITAGLLWDFDLTLGFGWYDNAFSATFTQHYERSFRRPNWRAWPEENRNLFFLRFFQDPLFLVQWKESWNRNFDTIHSMLNFIDEMADMLSESATENYKRWRVDEQVDYEFWINETRNYFETRVNFLNVAYNTVSALPDRHSFDTTKPEIPPQTFTLVAYGEMLDLDAVLQNAHTSAFEIVSILTQTPTGSGGYLATISVALRREPWEIHRDTLILSGINQGDSFLLRIPLGIIDVADIENAPLQAFPNPVSDRLHIVRDWQSSGEEVLVELFSMSGRRVFSQRVYGGASTFTIDVSSLPSGVYFLRVGNRVAKIVRQ